MLIRFVLFNFGLPRFDEAEKTFMTGLGREGRRSTVYPPEFKNYEMKIHSNELAR
jgi:hypothetical protein